MASCQSPDVQRSSDKLFRITDIMRTGNQLTADYQELKAANKARNTFLFYSIDRKPGQKRTLPASQGYLSWADVYRQKLIELYEAVLQDKRLPVKREAA